MNKVFFKVEKQFCGECSLALRRFIGGMNGVGAVNVESGMISVEFDGKTIDEDRVRTLTRDSIERLGYRVSEE